MSEAMSFLEDIPDIPNWLEWLFVIGGAIFPAMLFGWRRVGVNWWASLSRIRALVRAERIIDDLVTAHQNKNNLAMFSYLLARVCGHLPCCDNCRNEV